ncbi:Dauer Up-regulated [Cystobacter fuscus]|uniref:Dauer Up-regulated n=1 Tax=Cystobacter fuscus TaxID=43 RepID=UPI002B294A77|nr:Dauer Up-regulated [Cystobacter fuscus]
MSRPVDSGAAEAAARRAAAEAAARRAAEEAARRAAEKAAAEAAAKAAARQQAESQQPQTQKIQAQKPQTQLFERNQFAAGDNRAQNRLSGEPPVSATGTPTATGSTTVRQLATTSAAPTARNAARTGETPPERADALPENPKDLPKLFPELQGKGKEEIKKAYDSLNKLATGSFSEKATALGELASQFPQTVPNALERLGVKDSKLAKLATNSEALGALGTLSNPDKSAVDKAKASLTLAKAAGDILKPADLKGVLDTTLKGLPSAEKLIGAVSKWADPNASGVDKAKATLELGKALKDFAGEQFPDLANDLRKLDGPLRAAGAAITLFDPKASVQDKALAAAQLAAELPDLKKNVTGFAQLLRNAGVSQADEVAQQGARLAEVAVKGLDPALASKLSPAQLDKLKAAATKLGGPDSLESVLGGVTDPKALDNLVGQLDSLDAAAGKRLVGALGGLEHSVLNETLADPKVAGQLSQLATKLDDDAGKVLANAVKDMDGEALKSLLRFTDGVGADALNTTIKGLGPLVDKAGSKLVGQGLKVLDKALGKMGVEITAEVAGKVFKNLAKAIPVAGAVPNAIDAVKYEKEALELRGKNNDLGYFAHTAASLNVVDAGVGIALDVAGVFTGGAGVAVDVGTSVAFGAAELAMDIGFDQEKAKYEADPENYEAPGWMKAVNLAGAAAQGPAGMAQLAAYYGPEGAAELAQWGVETGAKGAVKLAEFAGVSAAEATGDGLKLTAGFIHKMADVVRNPSRYGEAVARQATEAFNAAIAKGGEIAKEAQKVLDNVITEAKELGTKGLETLKYLAENPGEVAKKALDGIQSLVNSGIDLTTKFGKDLYKKAVDTLEGLKAGWEKLEGAAKQKAQELINGARDLVTSTVNKAKELGEKGLELLAWTASHPGEAAENAKRFLSDTLAKGGELAKKAWDSVSALGEQGLAVAEDVVRGLAQAGEAAVDTLRYVAEHPGEAAAKVRDWAGQTLSDLARKGGEAAKAAATAVKDFVDRRADWAKKFARDLLKDGVESFKEVAKAWKDNLTEGGKEVMGALADLGDAGVDALKDLAGAGGQLAEAAVGHLDNLARAGVGVAKDALEGLADLGGDVGKLAGDAFDSVTDFLEDKIRDAVPFI